MGTNYYIHKRNRLPADDLIHIGKSVFKKPNGEFIWAMTPDEFEEMFNKNTGLIVVDEVGERMGYIAFMAKIVDRDWNCEHLGTSFS
ncbi:MAG: hypothetical protein A4E27_00650 [Methanobacterium sp. PtaU1.Bin242]|nr:MAG: hypothetical protein A4E27_00650 [Methanobacterium sp. PtaU1.Bin242]